jgi:hypothetical protein
VRISSDPRLEYRFKESLVEHVGAEAAKAVPTTKIPPNLTKERAEEVFQQVISLVDIRYKELDQLTDHGALALPKGSSLELLLHPIQPELNDK